MSDRGYLQKGSHFSRRLLPVALLLCASVIWSQQPAPADAVKPAASASTPAAPGAKAEPAQKPRRIQLYLGEAKDLLPESQWETLVATQPRDDASEEGDLPSLGHQEDVEVKGKRTAPKVPSGIAGLFWALRHPTQAWRAFTPPPAEQ